MLRSARRRRLRALPGPLAVHGPHPNFTALHKAALPVVGPTGTTRCRRSNASTHAHLSAAGHGTLWEPLAASGPEEMPDSEVTYACTRAYLDTAWQRDPQGTVGHGQGRKSCVTQSGHTDSDVDMT